MTNLTTQVCQAFLVENQNLRHRKQKKGTPYEKGYPSCGQTKKTVCGICVVSYGIEIMKLGFCNKRQEKSAVFV